MEISAYKKAAYVAASQADIDSFVNGALVAFVQACLHPPYKISDYNSLLNCQFIHKVFLQIDPDPLYVPEDLSVPDNPALCTQRVKYFECVLHNMRLLYEEDLHYAILNMPDAYVLGYHPETTHGLEQMKILLTLLIGAAVLSPNKETFVGRIRCLNTEFQTDLVDIIKEVTEGDKLVVSTKLLPSVPATDLYNHVQRLTQEREEIRSKFMELSTKVLECIEENITDLNLIIPDANPAVDPAMANRPTIGPNGEVTTDAVARLSHLRAKMRNLRAAYEDKHETVVEISERYKSAESLIEKLRKHNIELQFEANRAKAYRDEIELLRNRVEELSARENELHVLREKHTNTEFYKERLEELREDNRVLLENKRSDAEILEQQIKKCRALTESKIHLEIQLSKLEDDLDDMKMERDGENARAEDLLKENSTLQMIIKQMREEHNRAQATDEEEEMLSFANSSISEQLANSAQSRVIKLEHENTRLALEIDHLKGSSLPEMAKKIRELNRERKLLNHQLKKLEEKNRRLASQNQNFEDEYRKALNDNLEIEKKLKEKQKQYDDEVFERENDRMSYEALQVNMEALEAENTRLHAHSDCMSRRAEDQTRLVSVQSNEVERLTQEAARSKEKLHSSEMQINTLQRESSALLREINKLKMYNQEKSVQLEEINTKFETQKKQLVRLTKAREDCDQAYVKISELQKETQDLQSQYEVASETIEALRNELVTNKVASNKIRANLQRLGIDDDQNPEEVVKAVIERLVRDPDAFKTVREIILSLSNDQQKSRKCVICLRDEDAIVARTVELSNQLRESLQTPIEVENELKQLRAENREVNSTNTTLRFQKDNLQEEIIALNVDLSTARAHATALAAQQTALQLSNSQLVAEKDALLRRIAESKDEHLGAKQDQMTLQKRLDGLLRDYDAVIKENDNLKDQIQDARSETMILREQLAVLEHQNHELLRKVDNCKATNNDYDVLRAEHVKLTEDFRSLFTTSDRFKTEYRNIQARHKTLRAENNVLKHQLAEVKEQLSSRNDQVHMLRAEYANANQRCELLYQNNTELDIERKTLMENISQLLTQYHELLSISIEDKHHYHEEEKGYAERVHNLVRQKEKLEEKIMDHYKKSDTTANKKKPFASGFVRRVKKASSELIGKVPRNRRSYNGETRLASLAGDFDSGGNDSDNSAEDPSSFASDSIQRDASARQSIQRSLEAPDVTGSSLTLGAAGSRRTVYLVDEDQKLSDTASTSVTSNRSGNTTPIPPTNVNGSTPNPGHQTNNGAPAPPSTFIMYNKINTTLGGTLNAGEYAPSSMPGTSNQSGHRNDMNNLNGDDNGDSPTDDRRNPRKRGDEKSSSTYWLEYGCV